MNHLYSAILSHYKSKESEALAVLDMYFTNSIGVPSHSNILEELQIWTEKLTSARDNIKTLEEMVKFTDAPEESYHESLIQEEEQ